MQSQPPNKGGDPAYVACAGPYDEYRVVAIRGNGVPRNCVCGFQPANPHCSRPKEETIILQSHVYHCTVAREYNFAPLFRSRCPDAFKMNYDINLGAPRHLKVTYNAEYELWVDTSNTWWVQTGVLMAVFPLIRKAKVPKPPPPPEFQSPVDVWPRKCFLRFIHSHHPLSAHYMKNGLQPRKIILYYSPPTSRFLRSQALANKLIHVRLVAKTVVTQAFEAQHYILQHLILDMIEKIFPHRSHPPFAMLYVFGVIRIRSFLIALMTNVYLTLVLYWIMACFILYGTRKKALSLTSFGYFERDQSAPGSLRSPAKTVRE